MKEYEILEQIRILYGIIEFCVGKKLKYGYGELINKHKKYNLQD